MELACSERGRRQLQGNIPVIKLECEMNDVRKEEAGFRFIARIALFVVLAGLSLSGGRAEAQTNGVLREACMADFQKFCGNVQRGGGRIRQCMLDNADKLTPQCREAMKRQAGSQ
ncbi:MAG: cysteine rich repeat-containing protein [Pseudomonadota bacterium]